MEEALKDNEAARQQNIQYLAKKEGAAFKNAVNEYVIDPKEYETEQPNIEEYGMISHDDLKP